MRSAGKNAAAKLGLARDQDGLACAARQASRHVGGTVSLCALGGKKGGRCIGFSGEGPAGLPPARGAWAGGPAAAWRGTTAGSSAALLMCAVLVSHQEAEAAEAAAAHARHLQAAQLRCGVAPSAPRAAAIAVAVEQAAAVGAARPLLPAARQMEGV